MILYGVLMIKPKSSLVKVLHTPDFTQALFLNFIGKAIGTRHTQLGINLRKDSLLWNVPL